MADAIEPDGPWFALARHTYAVNQRATRLLTLRKAMLVAAGVCVVTNWILNQQVVPVSIMCGFACASIALAARLLRGLRPRLLRYQTGPGGRPNFPRPLTKHERRAIFRQFVTADVAQSFSVASAGAVLGGVDGLLLALALFGLGTCYSMRLEATLAVEHAESATLWCAAHFAQDSSTRPDGEQDR